MTVANLGVNNDAAGAESLVITTGAAAAAAKTILVALHINSDADGSITPTIADSAGNSYTLDLSIAPSGGAEYVRLWRCSNNLLLPSSGTITLTFASTPGVFASSATAWYDPDIAIASPLSGTPASATGSSTTPSSGSMTTLDALTRMYGVIGKRGLIGEMTQDGDFSTSVNGEDADTGSNTTRSTIYVGDRDLTSTVSDVYAPSISAIRAWGCGVIAYKMAAVGAAAVDRRGGFRGVARGIARGL